MTTKKHIQIRIIEDPEIDAVGRMWSVLEPSCVVSFFQSWGWVGTWLHSMPATVRVRLIVAELANEVVGLGILVPQKLRRHVAFTSRALFLNEAGQAKYDFIVEHNGFLLKSGIEAEVLEACMRYLVSDQLDWDELFVSGIRADSPLFNRPFLDQLGLGQRVLRISVSPYVDLEELRLSRLDYLSTVSSNRRAQIRRSVRKYERRGPVELRVAATPDEAHQVFDRLKELHQAHWTAKGQCGSFALETWERFHRALIDTRFPYGEIQMAQISAGGETIGCLYNIVKNGWVYVQQTGFRYETDRDFRPGYVSHYLAIEYNMKRGEKAYDFLAGESQYKTSLSNKDHQLMWVVLQRKRTKFMVENFFRTIKRIGKNWHRRPIGGRQP